MGGGQGRRLGAAFFGPPPRTLRPRGASSSSVLLRSSLRLRSPRLRIHSEELPHVVVAEVDPVEIQLIDHGKETDSGLDRFRLTTQSPHDPVDHPWVIAETGPDECPVGVATEPVHRVNARKVGRLRKRAHLEPVAPMVRHVVAAERRHGEGARRSSPRLPSAAAVFSLDIVAPMKTPCATSHWSDASTPRGTPHRWPCNKHAKGCRVRTTPHGLRLEDASDQTVRAVRDVTVELLEGDVDDGE